jgi:hypothetical protein
MKNINTQFFDQEHNSFVVFSIFLDMPSYYAQGFEKWTKYC